MTGDKVKWAKLIKKTEYPDRPYYFTKYEFICVDCGAHYTRHRFDNRTSPYCGPCHNKHERIKYKERAKKRAQEITELKRKAQAYDRLIKWMEEHDGITENSIPAGK